MCMGVLYVALASDATQEPYNSDGRTSTCSTAASWFHPDLLQRSITNTCGTTFGQPTSPQNKKKKKKKKTEEENKNGKKVVRN